MSAASRQPSEHDLLAPDAIREAAEEHEEGRSQEQRGGDQEVGRLRLDFEHLGEEEQGVELAAVPHHRLAGGGSEERQDHQARFPQRAKDSVSGALERVPAAFISRNTGDSASCMRM